MGKAAHESMSTATKAKTAAWATGLTACALTIPICYHRAPLLAGPAMSFLGRSASST